MDYFAGANTYGGFCHLFDGLFREMDRVFIIKGSSGCGKSTLMKKLWEYGETQGQQGEKIFCSADTRSLDGVIFPHLSVALVDGTAPHVLEPRYVGVRDVTVDMGRFLDRKKLMNSREKIIAISDKKSSCFSGGYAVLATAGSVENAVRTDCKKEMDAEKIYSRCSRILDKAAQKKGTQKKIFASAFTKDGVVTLPVFGRVERVFFADDRHFFAKEFLLALSRMAYERGSECVVALSPLDASDVEALFFPHTGTLVSTRGVRPFVEAAEEKSISYNGFFGAGIKSMRLREKTVSKLIPLLLSEAADRLGEAAEFHSELEKIYVDSANFDGINSVLEELKKEIFL